MACKNCRYFDENDTYGGKGYCSWYKQYYYETDNCSHFESSGGSSGCFLTTACCSYMGKPDDCTELTVLRNFRDTYMKSTSEGTKLVKEYYDIAPLIVNKINTSENKNDVYKHIYSIICDCVRFINNKEYEKAQNKYVDIVEKLKKVYIDDFSVLNAALLDFKHSIRNDEFGFSDDIVEIVDSIDIEFLEIIKGVDIGDELAKEILENLYATVPLAVLKPKIHIARAIIYKETAQKGERNAIIYYARGLGWLGKKYDALRWLMKLTEKSDTEAMLELAFQYTDLGFMTESPRDEIKWTYNAAVLGDALAQVKYGQLLSINGHKTEAEEWYKKSADNGNSQGCLAYAKIIYDDAKDIDFYASAMQAIVPEQLEKVRKYGLNTKEECLNKVRELYVKTQQLCINAINKTQDTSVKEDALDFLAWIYLYAPQAFGKKYPYTAAHIYFQLCYYFGKKEANDALNKTIREYGLNITNQTINEWKSPNFDFDKWCKKNNIDE